jgi:UrcA family protein
MFRSIGFPLVAALALIAAAQSATAAPRAERLTERKVSVPYGDLDLRTPADAFVMLTRLEQAAKRACGGDPSLNRENNFLFPQEKRYQDCRSDAVWRAVAKIDASLLTDLHRSVGIRRLARASAD